MCCRYDKDLLYQKAKKQRTDVDILEIYAQARRVKIMAKIVDEKTEKKGGKIAAYNRKVITCSVIMINHTLLDPLREI